MSRSAQDILASWLNDLLPQGAAWPRQDGSNLAGLLMALALSRHDVENDLDALVLEISPQTATLLLGDYETVLGPDPYGRDIGTLTTAEMQSLLFSRWVARGGQSIPYYKGLGAAIGVSLEIYEPEPAVYDVGQYGAEAVYSLRAIDNFTWVVILPNDRTGMEPIILGNRQPDTQVVFRYAEGVGFGQYDFQHILFGT